MIMLGTNHQVAELSKSNRGWIGLVKVNWHMYKPLAFGNLKITSFATCQRKLHQVSQQIQKVNRNKSTRNLFAAEVLSIPYVSNQSISNNKSQNGTMAKWYFENPKGMNLLLGLWEIIYEVFSKWDNACSQSNQYSNKIRSWTEVFKLNHRSTWNENPSTSIFRRILNRDKKKAREEEKLRKQREQENDVDLPDEEVVEVIPERPPTPRLVDTVAQVRHKAPRDQLNQTI